MASHTLDRQITVFRLSSSTADVVTRVNVYKKIYAYFRQLSDEERVYSHENGTESTCEFEINRRAITTDEYVEYSRKDFGTTYYQVTAVDSYDEHESHIKVLCREVEHKLPYTSEVDS